MPAKFLELLLYGQQAKNAKPKHTIISEGGRLHEYTRETNEDPE